MATGGSGDVLTGLITGLIAQGHTSEEAAIMGVFIHGLAGDIVAAKHTEQCLIADDIIENIPEALKQLLT
jgi:ADP-dependent NAD(P)H-hydrate dehydratase / NAD(P)H-hydrate epimerase